MSEIVSKTILQIKKGLKKREYSALEMLKLSRYKLLK